MHVLVANNAKEEKQLTLAEYLSSSNRKQLLKAFLLPAYPKDRFIYDSYKVSGQFVVWISTFLTHRSCS